MTSLFLIRHGATVAKTTRQFTGQIDPPLGTTGWRQASRVGCCLAGITLTGIFCSDLKRTRQTAGRICHFHSLAARPLSALREISLGAWEGLPMEQVRTSDPAAWEARGKDFAGFRPPGGESFGDLQRRVVPVLESMAATTTGTLVLVTHAGVIRVFLCHVLSSPLADLFGFKLDYCSLTRIDYLCGRWHLRALNLSPEAFRQVKFCSSAGADHRV